MSREEKLKLALIRLLDAIEHQRSAIEYARKILAENEEQEDEMKTVIDQRHSEAGFVIVQTGRSEKRAVFAPHRTKANTLVLSNGNWGLLTDKEMQVCEDALHYTFITHSITRG